MCSCVMLLSLERMRLAGAWDRLMAAAWTHRSSHPGVRVSNQGLLYLVLRRLKAAQFLPLDPLWNVAGCQHFNGCTFARSAWACGAPAGRAVAGAMHANCVSPFAAQPGRRYSSGATDDAWLGVTGAVGIYRAGLRLPVEYSTNRWNGFDTYAKTVSQLSWSGIRSKRSSGLATIAARAPWPRRYSARATRARVVARGAPTPSLRSRTLTARHRRRLPSPAGALTRSGLPVASARIRTRSHRPCVPGSSNPAAAFSKYPRVSRRSCNDSTRISRRRRRRAV